MQHASGRIRFVVLAVLALVATSCGSDADQGAPVQLGPTSTVDPASVTTVSTLGVETTPPTTAMPATPLGADEVIRYEVLDCDGSCHKELTVTADGGYRMVYGTGEEKTGTFEDETFPVTLDRIAETDFVQLRSDVADSCADAEENFDVLQHYQFRTASGVEVLAACGPAPGGSKLLAGVGVLAMDVALAG